MDTMNAASPKPSLRILAFGDSLTAGYYSYGRDYHPYATHLTTLLTGANFSVQIDQKGVSGERVEPTMTKRLARILETNVVYDWVIILGGTNDLAGVESPEVIFNQGLKSMYDMCLNDPRRKMKLAVLTVPEIGIFPPTDTADQKRQTLNTMIRNYVATSQDQDRICLVDLDRGIPYHSMTNEEEREQVWDDGVHLTPMGYDRMAVLIFDTIKTKL